MAIMLHERKLGQKLGQPSEIYRECFNFLKARPCSLSDSLTSHSLFREQSSETPLFLAQIGSTSNLQPHLSPLTLSFANRARKPHSFLPRSETPATCNLFSHLSLSLSRAELGSPTLSCPDRKPTSNLQLLTLSFTSRDRKPTSNLQDRKPTSNLSLSLSLSPISLAFSATQDRRSASPPPPSRPPLDPPSIVISLSPWNAATTALHYLRFMISPLGLTEKFKEEDTSYSGSATFTYESFMLTMLPFLIS